MIPRRYRMVNTWYISHWIGLRCVGSIDYIYINSDKPQFNYMFADIQSMYSNNETKHIFHKLPKQFWFDSFSFPAVKGTDICLKSSEIIKSSLLYSKLWKTTTAEIWKWMLYFWHPFNPKLKSMGFQHSNVNYLLGQLMICALKYSI